MNGSLFFLSPIHHVLCTQGEHREYTLDGSSVHHRTNTTLKKKGGWGVVYMYTFVLPV